MKTRKQYMDGEISFSDYYSQFLDDKTEQELLSVISLEEIKNSKDEHLNDIPMKKWDSISGLVMGIRNGSQVVVVQPTIRKELADRINEANEGISPATLTCIYKQQARKSIRK